MLRLHITGVIDMAALSRVYTLREIADLVAPIFEKHGVEHARILVRMLVVSKPHRVILTYL